jgi:hypothetical protein
MTKPLRVKGFKLWIAEREGTEPVPEYVVNQLFESSKLFHSTNYDK